MRTKLIRFSDVRAINSRTLQLPAKISISEYQFELITDVCAKDSIVTFYLSIIWHNQWAHSSGIIIPDFAVIKNTRKGYYMEQTTEMQVLRENTLECSFCKTQYNALQITRPFCDQCIEHPGLDERDLYLLYLRPVATTDIELNPKSIYIPEWLKDQYNNLHTPQIETKI